MTQLQALLPLKDLVDAKSRLSGLLRPAERRALAQAMVEDVLSVLAQHPSISTVTLLSDDPSAHMLAAKYGIAHRLESSLGCVGLNPVIERGCDLLLAQCDDPIIVLHGDLPALSADDISAVAETLQREEALIVGCDRHRLGTNLLAFESRNRPEFYFGVDSCARHCDWAARSGVPVKVLHRTGIALDIDEPKDLAELMEMLRINRPSACSQLLSDSELGKRIVGQLASLNPVQPYSIETENSKGANKQ
jgi:2-phospho-L-lactate guanylyltransferase